MNESCYNSVYPNTLGRRLLSAAPARDTAKGEFAMHYDTTPIHVSAQDEARLWAGIDRSPGQGPNGDCWEWTRACCDKGYGRVRTGKANRRAHRAVWTLLNGPIPHGVCVLHRCDNPPCCNPDHLWLGTHDDNVADKVAKGRSPIGERNGARIHPERLARGERNGFAKLTTADAEEILQLLADGVTGREIAARFGVTPTTISQFKHGTAWAHLPRPLASRRAAP